nr:hypothetical protein [Nostoc sp. CreGUA01]
MTFAVRLGIYSQAGDEANSEAIFTLSLTPMQYIVPLRLSVPHQLAICCTSKDEGLAGVWKYLINRIFPAIYSLTQLQK